MHIVYRVVFTNRQKNNELPYYYIGSKSNCTIHDGKIIDKHGKAYYGTSSWKDYDVIVSNDCCKIEVLSISEKYQDILKEERNFHIEHDVVASPYYFNKSVATTVNNFSDPDFATYKHIIHGKIVRLERNHPMVLSGEYVGVSSGTKMPDAVKLLVGRSGVENGFFGRKHSEETKQKISSKNKGRVKSQEEIDNWIEKVAKLSMSEEHRKIISEHGKNKIMLKNFATGECIKIDRSEAHLYDSNFWKNPAVIQKKFECIYCGVLTNQGNLNRWHNENCKHKGTK